MANLVIPKYRVLDDAGAPIASGTLEFFEAGGSTPKPIYPTEADLLAGTNAVTSLTSDSSGYFGEVFGTEGEEYKVVLKDSSGTEIWSADNINVAQLSSSSLVTRVKQIASNPLDYGAVGDGAADESAEVQSAIDAATKVVDLLGKTFRCDDPITLRSGIILKNGTLDFTSCDETEYIKIQGSIGSYTSLDSDASYQALTVSATTAGITAGDVIVLNESSGAYVDDEPAGELLEVISYSSPTITPVSPIKDNYETTNTARVAVLTTVDDVVLRDLTIISSATASGTAARTISAKMCRRLTIERCTIDEIDAAGAGIYLGSCMDTTVRDCEIQWSSTGDGIVIQGASNTIAVENCRFFCHATTPAGCIAASNDQYSPASEVIARGVVRELSVRNCTFKTQTTAVLIDENCQDVEISNNRIRHRGNSVAAITVRCVDATVSYNRIDGDTAGLGIRLTSDVPAATDRRYYLKANDNTIECGAGGDIYFLPTAWTSGGANAGDLAHLEICRNHVEGDINVDIGSSTDSCTITKVVLSNNVVGVSIQVLSDDTAALTIGSVVIDSCTAGTTIAVTGASENITNVWVRGCEVVTSGNNALTIDDVTSAKVSDNYFAASGSSSAYAVVLTDIVRVDFTGNLINDEDSPSSLGVHLNAVVTSTLYATFAYNNIRSNNGAASGEGASLQADLLTGAITLAFVGNVFRSGENTSGRYGVCISATGAISGIVYVGNASSISGDAASNTAILASVSIGCIVNGNYFSNGAVGLTVNDGASTVGPNAYNSCTANGAFTSDSALDFDDANTTESVGATQSGSIGVRVGDTVRYIPLYTTSA